MVTRRALKKADMPPEMRECYTWKDRIHQAIKDQERWVKRCETIIKRYRDERTLSDGSNTDDKQRRYNILWANIQTLRPALYGQEPVPIVERRFLDRDPVARAASQIWERAIRYQLSDSHFHRTMKKSVLDYLLVARAVPWVRYESQMGDSISPAPAGDDIPDRDDEQPDDEETEYSGASEDEDDDEGSEGDQELPEQSVINECANVDYVHWQDFLTSKARVWEEVDWVARRLFMSREEVEDRFGEEVARDITLDHMPENQIDSGREAADDDLRKATVFEIWCKTDKMVRFIAQGYEKLLEEPREDPLRLESFWPCPEPLYATTTHDSLIPVPDYIEYQDQALELDSLTNRCAMLEKALKVVGLYDASITGIQRMLDEGTDNTLIPVSTWAMFAEKGGIKGAIDFLPIEQIAGVLTGLYQARDKVKQDLYEITGIADILRGQSDPNETYGAQRIKSNFGSLRLSERQGEVARYARDTIRILAEVIAEHFSDETLIRISGAVYDEALQKPNPAYQMAVQQLAQQAPVAGPPSPPPGGSPAPAAPSPQGPPGMPPGQPPGAPQMGAPPQPMPGAPPPHPPMGGPPPSPAVASSNPQVDAILAGIPKMIPDVDLIQKAVALLRNDKLRGFRIDVETDSTVQADATQEKADRIAFIQAVTQFMQAGMAVAAQSPDAVPLMGKMLQFGVRGFRVGRDLEASIDEFVDQAEKQAKAKAGAPPQPTPEMIKANSEQAKAQAEIEAQKIEAQSEQQNAQMGLQHKGMDIEIKKMDLQMKGMEVQAKQQELAMKAQMMERDAQLQAQKHAMEMEQMHATHQHKLAQVAMQPAPLMPPVAPNGMG